MRSTIRSRTSRLRGTPSRTMATTWAPRASSASTTQPPRSPVAPVTRTGRSRQSSDAIRPHLPRRGRARGRPGRCGRMASDVWRDRPVLVTGATGLLGGWVVEALLARGAHVVAIVRDGVPRSRLVRERIVERIDVASGDVADYLFVERVLAEYEIECVFHLAAQTIVGIANRAPLSTFETNVRGTWNVLEAARRVPTVQQVVVASSDKAYGDHETLPYDETAPLVGRHPYDVSKSAADLIARSYWSTFGVRVAVT